MGVLLLSADALVAGDKKRWIVVTGSELVKRKVKQMQEQVKQKLEAFERLQPEFEASFRFVQDVHGERSWNVVAPTDPLRPFAEHIIRGYLELASPSHNNLMGHRFVDRPERRNVTRV
jgi:hypothetical protein